MSKLAETIKASTPEPPKMSLNEWLISLDPDDTKAVEEMGRSRAWSHAKVHAFITAQRVAVAKETVIAWRGRIGYGS